MTRTAQAAAKKQRRNHLKQKARRNRFGKLSVGDPKVAPAIFAWLWDSRRRSNTTGRTR